MIVIKNPKRTILDIDWDSKLDADDCDDCLGCPCWECDDESTSPYSCVEFGECEYMDEICDHCPVRVAL